MVNRNSGTASSRHPFDALARILIVEDEPCARTLSAEAAEQSGHAVDCVSTKADSEALLEGGSHDLAICDVELPDASGHDVAAIALSFGIKSLLITGHEDAGAEDGDRKIAYLRKPFDLRRLQKVIAHHLDS